MTQKGHQNKKITFFKSFKSGFVNVFIDIVYENIENIEQGTKDLKLTPKMTKNQNHFDF